jgi:uncharacterized membrane protein
VSDDTDPDDLAPPAVLTPEERDKIPPEVRPKVDALEALVREQHFEMIRSPLLPPDLLQRYDNVVPGLSAKLVKWTEDETEHRRSLERDSFNAARVFRLRGQTFGFTVSVVGLMVAGGVLAVTDSTYGMLGAGIIAIVAVGGPFTARILAGRWGRSSLDNADETG